MVSAPAWGGSSPMETLHGEASKEHDLLRHDRDAEEAARFHAKPFLIRPSGAPRTGDFPSGKGDVLTVDFTVMGAPCLGSTADRRSANEVLVSGRHRRPGRNGSLLERLVDNGGQESACGWCKDKWDCPADYADRVDGITNPDPLPRSAFDAMMLMRKIDRGNRAALRG